MNLNGLDFKLHDLIDESYWKKGKKAAEFYEKT
jgi:hypothetical protein